MFTEEDFDLKRTFPTGEYRTGWLICAWTGPYLGLG
jgi:hypothetical protein